MGIEKWILPDMLGGGETKATANPHEKGRYDVEVPGLGRVTIDGEKLKAVLSDEPPVGSVVLSLGGQMVAARGVFEHITRGIWRSSAWSGDVSWEWINRHAERVITIVNTGRRERDVLYSGDGCRLRHANSAKAFLIEIDYDGDLDGRDWVLTDREAAEFASAIFSRLVNEP